VREYTVWEEVDEGESASHEGNRHICTVPYTAVFVTFKLA
jgi:hypothetical protein